MMEQQMDDLMLPPLPEPARIEAVQFCDDGLYFTPEQMREYAKMAVEAERARVAPLLDKLEDLIGRLD